MKTLIFNGSPRKNGDTAFLLSTLKAKLGGEFHQIDTYFSDIKPCVDCRYCWAHDECAVKDEMQQVFSFIEEVDNIVIASPIYFSELSGSMLNVLSRLQYFYSAKHFRDMDLLIHKKRNGIIILSGGGDGSPNKAIETATCLLHHMGAEVVGTVCSHNTNTTSAKDDTKAITGIKVIAERILTDMALKMLETERLILRGWKPDDVRDLYEYAKDPNVGAITGWAPHTCMEDSVAVLKSYIENDNAWAIELKESHKVIGMIKIYPDNNHGRYHAMMINYALSAAYWGHGYMTETVSRVMRYAFEELNIDLLTVFHYPQNVGSRRVIEKCGFEYDGTIEQGCTRYDGQVFDAVCHSLLREDWLKQKTQ